MKANPIGLYLHLPFCLKKCNYCDFCSFAGLSASVREEYISALVREISSYKRDERISVDTVFFGGGTPSLLTPTELARIFSAIGGSFDILPDAEITLEANPKTFTPEKIRDYAALGVNRLSIGLQSIHENELKKLGRIHNLDDFKSAYDMTLSAGIQNINVDLMYGIPDQSLKSLSETLSFITSISPTHLSAYGLIVEEGTPFFEARDSLLLPSDDEEYMMYREVCSALRGAGYRHYEISNYAKPGYESRHNLKYWQNREYIGVGISAYSYYGDSRYGNTHDLTEYLSCDYARHRTVDPVDFEVRAFEYAMLGLRRDVGIDTSEYERLAGRMLSKEKIKGYVDLGYMRRSGDRISLTEDGFYVSNTILAELL